MVLKEVIVNLIYWGGCGGPEITNFYHLLICKSGRE